MPKLWHALGRQAAITLRPFVEPGAFDPEAIAVMSDALAIEPSKPISSKRRNAGSRSLGAWKQVSV